MSYLCSAFEMHRSCKWFGASSASLPLLFRFGSAYKWKTNKKGAKERSKKGKGKGTMKNEKLCIMNYALVNGYRLSTLDPRLLTLDNDYRFTSSSTGQWSLPRMSVWIRAATRLSLIRSEQSQ